MLFDFNFEYNFVFKTDFNPNLFSISKVYAPFMSKESFSLYVFLTEELKNANSFKVNINTIKEILLFLGLDNENFIDAKNNLESLDLLKTYVSDENVVYFELFEPLKIESFLNDKKFSSKLKGLIGDEVFNKLESQFCNKSFINNLKNISVKNLDNKINKIEKLNEFDFEELNKNINNVSPVALEIPQNVKNDISFFYKEYKVSEIDIEKNIYECATKTKNGFSINRNAMVDVLTDLSFEIINNKSNLIDTTICKEIFITDLSTDQINTSFSIYNTFSSTQFFTLLTREIISENDFDIVTNLRKKYSLDDSLINIMMNFSLRKTHGELNKKYLTKMAKSFNVNNITSLSEAYSFLKNWETKQNSKGNLFTKTFSNNFEKNVFNSYQNSSVIITDTHPNIDENIDIDDEVCINIDHLNLFG